MHPNFTVNNKNQFHKKNKKQNQATQNMPTLKQLDKKNIQI